MWCFMSTGRLKRKLGDATMTQSTWNNRMDSTENIHLLECPSQFLTSPWHYLKRTIHTRCPMNITELKHFCK